MTPKQTLSGLLQEFLRDFHQEKGFENAINSSVALRGLLFRMLSLMTLEVKREVLRVILFCEDERHAYKAAKRLATDRETWTSELLDAALQDVQPYTRFAALRGCTCRNPSYLIPRLRRAATDESERIRSYAREVLQSYPGEAAAFDVSVRCQLCGNRIDPAAMDQHQARHTKQADVRKIKVSIIEDNALPRTLIYEQGKPDHFEWDMTTFNTPKYRRK